jgi:hypothetical protein
MKPTHRRSALLEQVRLAMSRRDRFATPASTSRAVHGRVRDDVEQLARWENEGGANTGSVGGPSRRRCHRAERELVALG